MGGPARRGSGSAVTTGQPGVALALHGRIGQILPSGQDRSLGGWYEGPQALLQLTRNDGGTAAVAMCAVETFDGSSSCNRRNAPVAGA